MIITKLGHSCVLAETSDRVAIFDPGGWTNNFNINDIPRVDRIVITHQHGDHFDIHKIKKLIDKFPDAHIICNQDIEKLLTDNQINSTIRRQSECTVAFESPHEKLPVVGAVPPSQSGYHFKEMLTHPGDSHSFNETKKILLMPFVAPWGKIGDAVDKVIELSPEYVLPIHDWFFHDEARAWLDSLLEKSFEPLGIKLLSSKIGIAHKIE